jgi:hypothetical protein
LNPKVIKFGLKKRYIGIEIFTSKEAEADLDSLLLFTRLGYMMNCVKRLLE